MSYLYKFFSLMPAMANRKSPALSFLVGFLSSFWGLSFYFRTTVDLLIAITFTFLILNIAGSEMNPWLVNPMIDILVCANFTGFYALFRAVESNRRSKRHQ